MLDETFVTPDTSHQTLETRTAMAYWQNGKVHVYGHAEHRANRARRVALGRRPTRGRRGGERVAGGGFGGKITGAISLVIPVLLAKKANAPVMMRITREEEHYIGRGRPGVRGRMKVGFAKDGRITAVDMCSVSDNGPFERQGDCNNTGVIASLMYQPKAMRFRGISVLTNTPPRGPQSQPGGTQSHMLVEPVISKAARQLGIDQVAIRRINAPSGKALFGPPGGPKQERQYDERVRQGDARQRRRTVQVGGTQGAEREARRQQSARRRCRGEHVRAGSTGFDGLIVVKPDGHLHQSGIGNHGTESVSDCHRVSAEILGVPWDKVVVTWGDTAKNLPWTCNSGGSQTIHAMTRAAHAAGMDAKLQEIAAKDLGGRPDDYEVANERVFRKGGGPGMTLAKAAQRAIELGGTYDGHELPKDINRFTTPVGKRARRAGAHGRREGQLPARRPVTLLRCRVRRSRDRRDRQMLHPRLPRRRRRRHGGPPTRPRRAILGRSMLGIGHTIGQKWVYDQQCGWRWRGGSITTGRRRFSMPGRMAWAAGHPGSGDSSRCARYRRAAGRRRRLRGAQRDQRRAGRQHLPARPGNARHDPDLARSGQADDRAPDGAYLAVNWMTDCDLLAAME